MTHTDDLSNWTELDDSIADIIVGYTESMNDDEGKSHIDRIIAAVHASIAARALSDEVVEAVASAIHDVDTKRFPDVVRHIPARTVYHERARAALAAAGPEANTVYYTATQEVYDVSGTLDTEPKYANSFKVAGGPYETVEEAAENADDFRWIIGFRGVRPVSIRAASGFEAGEEEEIDCFRPHDLDDFLPEIVDAAITYRNAIATALAAKQEGTTDATD